MTTLTSQQLENFAAQLEQMGDITGAGVYRERAAVLRQQESARPPAPPAPPGVANSYQQPDGYIVLDNVDIPRLEQGWGSDWHRPTEVPSGFIAGETEGPIWPDSNYVKGQQLWLAFHSTDGNYYRDYIAIPFRTGAIGKLGDILRVLGIPYDIEGLNLKFRFDPGIPCKLLFQQRDVPDRQGTVKKEIRLIDVKGPDSESL